MKQLPEELGHTFRRDPTNYRSRINKPESLKDREQKLAYALPPGR
jgi:translation initiation factor RLI1